MSGEQINIFILFNRSGESQLKIYHYDTNTCEGLLVMRPILFRRQRTSILLRYRGYTKYGSEDCYSANSSRIFVEN